MIYAIGDIHGQIEMLDHALDLITQDGGPDADIVFLGDYTDRGLNSCAVIDRLIDGKASGKNWRFIKGNHDRMFTNFVTMGKQHDPLIAPGLNYLNPRIGGTNAIASYGVTGEPIFAAHTRGELEILLHFQTDQGALTPDQLQQETAKAVPAAHVDFVNNLPLWIETDDLIFVHAGIRPGVAMADQDPEDLLWIREGFLEDTTDHGKLIVHGHTALDAPTHFGNRIDLDAGAGRGGALIPAVFDGRECHILTDNGRVPLTPA
ncbi:serine/threonine protein phosphatase 1 [Loktanella ponticola]|uniref:Serine/threonine protein phosphatase 1 n=1 Tax=Yoonia ponticola TaxID=1524255 RepID=A0A7W9BHJ0_9RHOB|nr:metallophosphoesterase [Yoonia ponticola]MBB5720600.1 serine/threonine protein phosphatase 1 [Yoonia ponticola]